MSAPEKIEVDIIQRDPSLPLPLPMFISIVRPLKIHFFTQGR